MDDELLFYTADTVIANDPPKGMRWVQVLRYVGNGIAFTTDWYTLEPIPHGWHRDWRGELIPDEGSEHEHFYNQEPEEDDDDDWWR